ncbi:Lrp/AsnC family transcriptional regulator [Streptomyces violaceusniger]|uniref:Lrp/AsnC family transcriptional regulator n=1 Tax=Streptomyces violaceusniger TaxID=68280 RepID=UPI003427141C
MNRSVHGHGSDGLDEHDLALLHALQIAPRISWAEAARILGSNAATLAARWDRLRGRGLAWVTAYPGGSYRQATLALVEVDCLPGARRAVVDAVCRDPRAVTVEESTRGRDLLLTVITPDLAALTAFVLDDLEALPGVERQRTYVATSVHRHGTHWRLDALEPAQVRALEAASARSAPAAGTSPPAGAWPLIAALAKDGRRTAADLARSTGRNTATVRRQLARLISSDLLSFRCELATEVSGWSVSSTWTAHVEPVDQQRTIAALATLPELRMCLSTTGDANVAMTVWTRSLLDMLRIERLFGERLPWMRVRENAVNLRTPKRMGWMLDERGRATGEVVVPTALAAY